MTRNKRTTKQSSWRKVAASLAALGLLAWSPSAALAGGLTPVPSAPSRPAALTPAEQRLQQQELEESRGRIRLGSPQERAESAATLALESRENKAEALRLAAIQGWPVAGRLENGGAFELMKVVGGLPYYYGTSNASAAVSTRADLLRAAPYNLDGSGLAVGVWDENRVRTSHQEFGGRAAVQDNGGAFSSHATHVSGTIGASGVDPGAKGMAPAVTLKTHNWTEDSVEMIGLSADSPDGSSNVFVSNHSYGTVSGWYWNSGTGTWAWSGQWGNPECHFFGAYDQAAEDWDDICQDAPYYLPFKAAGNDRSDGPPWTGATFWYTNSSGTWTSATYNPAIHPAGDGQANSTGAGYDTIATYACAKNVMTVGAVDDSKNISSFSGWGPTDDGRIKPDIVANGVGVYSTDSGSDSSYGTKDGTSMATPNATGTAILLQQYYAQRYPGQAMRSSTLKGLIIHTAEDLGRPGPDYVYGWGLMNGKAAADLIKLQADTGDIYLLEDTLSLTNTTDDLLFYSNGVDEIRVTICWTDPEGSDSLAFDDPDLQLERDLDLRIISPDGTIAFLPYVMDPANPASNAGYGDNIRDNVEQVRILNPPVAGQYTARVTRKGFSLLTWNYSLIFGFADEPDIELDPAALTVPEP